MLIENAQATLVPNRLAYVWLYAKLGGRLEGCDGGYWPVNGWAPYLIWRWGRKKVELWHASTLTRIRIRVDDPVLRTARVTRSSSTPSAIALVMRRRMSVCERTEMPYFEEAVTVANYLSGLDDLNVVATPDATVDTEEVGQPAEGTKVMAKKDGTTAKRGGSGAFIREQLLLKNPKPDEEIAALARKQFGGNTGKSDVAWNRTKLRKEGKLPPSTRGSGAPKSAAGAKGKKANKKKAAKGAKVSRSMTGKTSPSADQAADAMVN